MLACLSCSSDPTVSYYLQSDVESFLMGAVERLPCTPFVINIKILLPSFMCINCTACLPGISFLTFQFRKTRSYFQNGPFFLIQSAAPRGLLNRSMLCVQPPLGYGVLPCVVAALSVASLCGSSPSLLVGQLRSLLYVVLVLPHPTSLHLAGFPARLSV